MNTTTAYRNFADQRDLSLMMVLAWDTDALTEPQVGEIRGDDNDNVIPFPVASNGRDRAQANGAIHVTFFRDQYAKSLKIADLTLEELGERIKHADADSKSELPWLKLARFGDKRSDKDSLRNDDNVEAISGILGDYDGKAMSFAEAAERVARARIQAILYTSPSYTEAAPKWRAGAPFSTELSPGQHSKMMARLNGVLGGVLASESFTLSQSYYYGSVAHNPAHQVMVFAGDYIDQRNDLDAGALGKGQTAKTDDYYSDSRWAAFANKQSKKPIDVDQALADMEAGSQDHSIHLTQLSVIAALLCRGFAADDVINEVLERTMEVTPIPSEKTRKTQTKKLRGMVESWLRKHPELKATAYPKNQEWRSEGLFDPWAQFVVPDFPLDILPPVARDFVIAQSTVIGVDRSSMAMCVLGALSGAINHSFTLKMMRHGDWFVSPRLWVLLYGDASKKKTPAFNAATKALEEHQREIQQIYKNELNLYEIECTTAEKGAKPQKPQPPPRWVMFDTSIEKLGEVLARSNKGLLFKKDEIAGWLGQMEKYGGSSRGAAADRGFWVQAYDGGYYVVDRINRGEIPVDNLSVSVLGGIQPKRLAELKGLTSDGLLQRFIPTVMGPTKLPQDCPCDTTAFHELLRRLIRLKPETMLTFSDSALEVMEKLRQQLFDLEQHSGGLADGFQSFVGKLQGMAGSLALLLHLASEPSGGGFAQFTHTGVVKEITAVNVRRLMVEFIIPHAFEFYRSTEAATNGDRLAQLASWILTNAKERFVASDLTSNVASFRGLTLYEINERVSPLIAAGWLKPDGKEPYCHAWNVNPAVFVQFAARTKLEEAAKQQLALAMNSFRKPRG